MNLSDVLIFNMVRELVDGFFCVLWFLHMSFVCVLWLLCFLPYVCIGYVFFMVTFQDR